MDKLGGLKTAWDRASTKIYDALRDEQVLQNKLDKVQLGMQLFMTKQKIEDDLKHKRKVKIFSKNQNKKRPPYTIKTTKTYC